MREIRNKPIVKQRYSSKEILASVKHIAGEARFRKKGERVNYIKGAVAELNREFQRSLGTWNFVISVENLKLQPRSFKVGDVTFFKFTPHKRKEMRTKIWKLIKDNPHYTTEWKRKYVKDTDEKVLSLNKDKTCALVQITGRLEKAQLIAYDKVETAIATLKLYRSPIYDSQRQYFHVTGKVVRSTNRLTLGYRENGKKFDSVIERVGFFFPFELDDKRIRFMRRAGFPKLHKILKKEKLNNLERRIINSIRLLGSAFDVVVTKSRISGPIGLGFPLEKETEPKTTFEEISLNDRLIRLFIALESLLIFDENEPLASNIAERGAFLLANTYEDRRRIKVFIKKMYKLRSAHVHHGKSKLNYPMLSIFTKYVQAIILRVILIKDRMKLTTERDLKNWFERKKLS